MGKSCWVIMIHDMNKSSYTAHSIYQHSFANYDGALKRVEALAGEFNRISDYMYQDKNNNILYEIKLTTIFN